MSSPPGVSPRRPAAAAYLFLPLLVVLHVLDLALALALVVLPLLRLPSTLLASPSYSPPSKPAAKKAKPPPTHIALLLVPPLPTGPDPAAAVLTSIVHLTHWASCIEGLSELTIFCSGGAEGERILRAVEPSVRERLGVAPEGTYTPDGSEDGRAGGKDKAGWREGWKGMTVWAGDTDDEEEVEVLVLGEGKRASRRRPITLNLLTPEASFPVLSSVAADLAREGRRPEDIDVALVDGLVRRKLPLSDPSLLLIHHLSPHLTRSSSFSPFGSSSSTSPAPIQLHGFPPWHLRVTELYQPPPPSFWSLWLRRTRWEEPRPLDRATWDGGMRAWGGVEQRYGR